MNYISCLNVISVIIHSAEIKVIVCESVREQITFLEPPDE